MQGSALPDSTLSECLRRSIEDANAACAVQLLGAGALGRDGDGRVRMPLDSWLYFLLDGFTCDVLLQ